MPTTPPERKRKPKSAAEDRRARPGTSIAKRLLLQLRGLFKRPMRLQQREGKLHVVLVDRRRSKAAPLPPSTTQMRSELGARLVAQRSEGSPDLVRHLVYVHDELGRKGWPGVQALPARLLAKAVAQAELLASQEASPAMSTFIDRLRPMKVAAELREERKRRGLEAESGERIEVIESTHEEFTQTQQSWFGTMAPPELAVEGSK
jgi:hypothetical protein